MLVVLLLVVVTNQGSVAMMQVNCHFGIAVTMLMLSIEPVLSSETMGLRFISTASHSLFEVQRKCDGR